MQINLLAIVHRHQVKTILDHRHHAEPKQIDLDDPHLGTVFLIPLNHGSARHRRTFERHDLVQHSLADHHAARVLTQVPRQVLHAQTKLQIFRNTWMRKVEARSPEVVAHGVACAAPFKLAHHAGKPAQRLFIESKRLAYFARSRLAAIRNHVRRHGRAKLSITLIHVLQRLFALVARR